MTKSRCPICGKKHKRYPTFCLDRAIIRHVILCGMRQPHRPSCQLEEIKQYGAQYWKNEVREESQ